MKDDNTVSRRHVIKASAGAVAGAFAASSMAGSLKPTPVNPEGPFYPIVDQTDKDADLTHVAGRDGRAQGEVVRVSGRVLDESGVPIANAVVDVWQANAAGRYDHEGDTSESPKDPNFQGWAILKTDAEGRYSFTTIKPGAYTAMDDWVRPPHIHYKVSCRGYRELITQMYWNGEPLNDTDNLFLSIPEEERKLLLVAFDDSGEVPEGEFNIVLAAVKPA